MEIEIHEAIRELKDVDTKTYFLDPPDSKTGGGVFRRIAQKAPGEGALRCLHVFSGSIFDISDTRLVRVIREATLVLKV